MMGFVACCLCCWILCLLLWVRNWCLVGCDELGFLRLLIYGLCLFCCFGGCVGLVTGSCFRISGLGCLRVC